MEGFNTEGSGVIIAQRNAADLSTGREVIGRKIFLASHLRSRLARV